MKRPNPKILIAHHRWWFPTAVSGADIANHEFARKLIEYGTNVRVVGITPPDIDRRTDRMDYVSDGIPVCLVRSNFIRKLRAEIREFKPDVVLTSCPEPSCGADDITRMVETFGRFDLPLVLYVHDVKATLPLFENVKNHLALVITNSHFMADCIAKKWSIRAEVVYPVPEWDPIKARQPDGSFITFFNPTPHKGLGIGNALVSNQFTDRPFLFVEGFIDPEAHGISLYRSGNLVHARQSPDVATIYGMSKTIIIPSQWEEPFGRVALEAMYNKIPVIASRTGGLVESVGDGGILVENFSKVDPWVEAILSLDDPKTRKALVDAGKKHVKKFSLDNEIIKLIGLLGEIAA